jgi:hypothetical protein
MFVDIKFIFIECTLYIISTNIKKSMFVCMFVFTPIFTHVWSCFSGQFNYQTFLNNWPVIASFSMNDRLKIPAHDFWVSGNGQMTIRLNFWDQLWRTNLGSPKNRTSDFLIINEVLTLFKPSGKTNTNSITILNKIITNLHKRCVKFHGVNVLKTTC